MDCTVIPILVGTHKNQSDKNGTWIEPHTGAVTLIKTQESLILVDTGARGTVPKIKATLKQNGVNISDIDTIILTHFHLDHAFNISLLAGENTKVIGWNHDWRPEKTIRLGRYDELYEISDQVFIFKTPGHAEEHISVLVKNTPHGNTVISGDAINEKYYVTNAIAAFSYDDDLYHASAKKIVDVADYIIPGHGDPFVVA